MISTNRLLLSCSLLLLLIPAGIIAQEKSGEQTPNELEVLRKRVEEQQTQIDRLKSVIDSLQQRLDKPNPSTSMSPTVTATSEKPATKPPKASVEVGYGNIKFTGLLQAQYVSGNSQQRDTFKIRRAELKFSGQITPEVKWTLMIDPAKALSANTIFTTINGTRVVSDVSFNQGSRVFQDGYITLNYLKDVQIDIGQFKLPLSLEGLQSSTKLETIERALMFVDRARGGGLGDVRDIGIMVSGPIAKHFNYQVGMFNGVGESHNDIDKNDQKTLIGRLVVSPPFIKGLRVGGSGALAGRNRPDRPRRDRLGLEAYYNRGPFTFKSELITAKDANLHRIGYYGLAAYKFLPKVEAVFRYDVFDPDRRLENNLANVIERDYVMGVNYYISENNVKLQFNYLRKTFNHDIVPARNLFLVNLQTSW
ncbi:MAG: porin [Acidobacteriota bacterium]